MKKKFRVDLECVEEVIYRATAWVEAENHEEAVRLARHDKETRCDMDWEEGGRADRSPEQVIGVEELEEWPW